MPDEHELRSAGLLLRITSSPHLRVSHISREDQPNLLLEKDGSPYVGLRTAVMEPHQTEYSFEPCNQPAESVDLTDGRIQLVGRVDPDSALQVCLEASIEGEFALIRHGVTNRSPRSRRLALWPIMVVPKQGIASSPFGSAAPDDGQPLRKLILWPTVPFDSPSIVVTERHASLAYEKISEPHVKFALVSTQGLASYEGQGQRLRSWVDYHPGANYPEGGGNISFYGNQEFAEVEHIGEIQSVASGATL